ETRGSGKKDVIHGIFALLRRIDDDAQVGDNFFLTDVFLPRGRAEGLINALIRRVRGGRNDGEGDIVFKFAHDGIISPWATDIKLDPKNTPSKPKTQGCFSLLAASFSRFLLKSGGYFAQYPPRSFSRAISQFLQQASFGQISYVSLRKIFGNGSYFSIAARSKFLQPANQAGFIRERKNFLACSQSFVDFAGHLIRFPQDAFGEKDYEGIRPSDFFVQIRFPSSLASHSQ